jgi:hypothetical protein
MNVLPFVIALLLILSVVTIEKFEGFKNSIIIQKEYQTHMEEKERKAFNLRQENLADIHQIDTPTSQRQLNFRYFIDKESRKHGRDGEMKQIRQINSDLMKVLYGHTTFFQDLEQKRPNFTNEILDALIVATDKLSKKNKIRTIEEISRIELEDEELQEAFYKMLKGTVTKQELRESEEKNPNFFEDLKNHRKNYLSYLTFIHFDKSSTIKVRFASKELLTAIFGEEELVDTIIEKRKELCAQENADATLFEEFRGKQKNGIADALLDFSIKKNPDIEKFD